MTWFLNLSTTAQWWLGAGFLAVIVGLVLLLVVIDGLIQRHRDRIEWAPADVPVRTAVAEPRRVLTRDLDDTTDHRQLGA